MNDDGQQFLERLAQSPHRTFERHFARAAIGLNLGPVLSAAELEMLYRAAYLATLCNIAFNGLGGCASKIKPEREANRVRLERSYMMARDVFYATLGWSSIGESRKSRVQNVFLAVSIAEHNLLR